MRYTSNLLRSRRRRFAPAALQCCEARLLLFAGQVDVSFGDLGTASQSLDAPLFASPSAVAVQPDGKLLVAGTDGKSDYNSPLIARYQSDGELDPTFGKAGRVDLSLDKTFFSGAPAFGQVKAALVQASGRILLVTDIGDDLSVLALLPDGTPDLTFGGRGDSFVSNYDTGNSAAINGATLLADQSLIIGGALERHDNLADRSQITSSKAAYVHILADGAIDPAYDDAFRTLGLKHNPDASIQSLAALPDGGAIAVGQVGDDVLLFKITPDGHATKAFSGNGWTATDFGQPGEAGRAVATLPDGSIALAGDSGGDIVLARYLPDGRAISTFGVKGQVRLDLGSTESAAGLLLAPDGRLIVVGGSGGGEGRAGVGIVAAFQQRGRLVRGFASSGVARIDFAAEPTNDNPASLQADANAVTAATFAGQSLVVVGSAPGTAESPPATRFGLAMLQPNGSLDPSFAQAGIGITPFQRQVEFRGGRIARQPDGKIVALTTFEQTENVAVFMRFTADGRPDPTFGDMGVLPVRLDARFGYADPRELQLDSAGGMIGLIHQIDGPDRGSVLIRVTSSGALDTGFGDHGLLNPGFSATAIAMQGSKIVVGGGDNAGAFIVGRFDASGRLDRSFAGGAGEVSFVFTREPNSLADPGSVLIAPDGKLVAVGSVDYGLFPQEIRLDGERTAIVRLSADGIPDPTFGNGGAEILEIGDYPSKYEGAGTGAFTSDGRLVLLGGVADSIFVRPQPIVARLLDDGSLDSSFGDSGVIFTNVPGSEFYQFSTLAIRPDGVMTLAGAIPLENYETAAAIRLTAQGALDTTYADHGLARGLVSDDLGDALIEPDGSITVATLNYVSGYTFNLTRFLGDQSPAISAEIDHGVLRVSGTPGADHILLRRHSEGIEIVSLPGRFNTALFSRIEISGLAGDDRIDASALSIPVTIDAGDGDDVVLGGSAADGISGGNGRDTLFGGQGNDTLTGDNGNDYLNPGPGNDQVFGNADNDQIYTRDNQPDTLDGGEGFDRSDTDLGDLLSDVEGLLRR
jgi:uncharacterized delta-60 repeat protein